jgi:hypothetical protein
MATRSSLFVDLGATRVQVAMLRLDDFMVVDTNLLFRMRQAVDLGKEVCVAEHQWVNLLSRD